MCAYSFTVFVSVFQLLPTAPYHVIDLGGTTVAAGLFLGFLTFSSAFSAPVTGSIGDRIGQRHVLITVSVVLAVITSSYAFITDYRLLLVLVIVHGLFWSALLSASGAYMTATIPENRRAEGLSYWGLSSVLAIAVAPALGFWVYRHGWTALCAELAILNLVMAAIAWRLPDDRHHDAAHRAHAVRHSPPTSRLVEWRVLALSIAMALISFGYGGLTSFSALFADHLKIAPRSVFLSTMALAILASRLVIGRTLDRRGYRRMLLPCLVVPSLGLLLLAFAEGEVMFLTAAIVFGLGFGLMYPAFTAYIMRHVPFTRRGAAFGAILAAFDTGVGTGSTALGWFIHHLGFRWAYVIAAGLAVLALPYFLLVEKRVGYRHEPVR
jgi:MFS family permease